MDTIAIDESKDRFDSRRQMRIENSMQSVARRQASKPEPLYMKLIPKIEICKLETGKRMMIQYKSQSARETSNPTEKTTSSYEDIEEMDRIFETLMTEQSVDSILRRSRRDELSKSMIISLNQDDFKKSACDKSLIEFPEYAELAKKAILLNERGEYVLNVSKLKLGDRHAACIADGFQNLTAETSSINQVSVRDNRLTDDGIQSLPYPFFSGTQEPL